MPEIKFSAEELHEIVEAGLRELGHLDKWRGEGYKRYIRRFRVENRNVTMTVQLLKPRPEKPEKPSLIDKIKDKAREFNFGGESDG